jgi:hypothetical protein
VQQTTLLQQAPAWQRQVQALPHAPQFVSSTFSSVQKPAQHLPPLLQLVSSGLDL